jgi:hypothetical protein
LAPLTGALSEKEASIVDVVEDKDPLSLPFVSQPVVNQLKYVGLRIIPVRDLDVVGNFPKTLLETGGITRVDPEHARIGRSLFKSIAVFDGKLRLSFL